MVDTPIIIVRIIVHCGKCHKKRGQAFLPVLQ
jgi:hypothetical protein